MTRKEKDLDFTGFGKLIWNYRKTFLITGSLAIILGVVISFLLPVYYRSTATIYPAAINYVASTDIVLKEGNSSKLGGIDQAEQILEMFGSKDFKDVIIQEFNLFQHYHIDSTKPHANFKIYNQFQSQITAKRSRFSAVNIAVVDKSPKMAAKITNGIIKNLNDFRNKIIRKRISQNMEILRQARDSVKNNFQKWTDSLNSLHQIGVVSKRERAGLFQSLGRNETPQIQQKIEVNVKYGSIYDIVEQRAVNIQVRLNVINKYLLQWKTSSAKGAAQQFVFEEGHIPDKKYSPKRSIVVLEFTAAVIVLLFLYLFLRENGVIIRKRLES